MPKFRKKQVVVNAVQWMKNNFKEIEEFYPNVEMEEIHPYGDKSGNLLIRTLEGTMVARPGDWVVMGIQGEFYPCKPDIFAATYEPIE